MIARLASALLRRLGFATTSHVDKLQQRLAQLDRKVDRLASRHDEERAILQRVAFLLERQAADGDEWPIESHAVTAPVVPPSRPDEWCELHACPICGDSAASMVCEYNRFVLADTAPDEASKIYNYALCHGCGVVYAARRPVGRRYRALLTEFHENLGRVGTPSAWLNPAPLTETDRDDLRHRSRLGALVSEHARIPRKQWLPGTLRDRLLVAQHVELLGSLLTLNHARVLEIRSRTGAMLESLRRLYGASVYALPMFESHQEIVRGLYGIPADALVDFERLRIPYDGPFDVVISNHMLTHAVQPEDLLDTVSAALAPGGHLYLYNEMDEAEIMELDQSMFKLMNPFHMQIFSPTSLVRALAARGFEVVFLTHTDPVHMVCLARKAAPVREPMPTSERNRRLGLYATARDLAILLVPEERRQLFAAEWNQVLERATRAELVRIDGRGRVRLNVERRLQPPRS